MDERPPCQLPERGILRLEDLPIHVWVSSSTAKTTTITRSPYYASLKENNPAIFQAYQETMRERPTASSEISWDQFLDLRNDIAQNGLRNADAPIELRDFGQIDGHHRLAILCHLYGPQAEVRISNGVVTFPVSDMDEAPAAETEA